ncbi:MAG TPA: hypothetical protein VF099_03125 [Ktedonobacterales bacterium]
MALCYQDGKQRISVWNLATPLCERGYIVEQQWTNARQPEQGQAQQSANANAFSQPQASTPSANASPPALRGWAMWVALILTLLGLLIAAAAWVTLGVALLTPFSVSMTVLALVFLAPIIGGVLSLPGVVFGLLATRQTRKRGARLTLPVSLVSVATLVLVAGLLFGGLVAYPRYQLGLFAQALQTDCGRVKQVLDKYKDLSPIELVGQAPQITATINQNQQELQADEAALDALSAPDNPDAQQLLDDCRTIISGTLNLPTLLNNPVGGAFQIQALYATYQDAQRLGDQLKLDVFAPFQPPANY